MKPPMDRIDLEFHYYMLGELVRNAEEILNDFYKTASDEQKEKIEAWTNKKKEYEDTCGLSVIDEATEPEDMSTSGESEHDSSDEMLANNANNVTTLLPNCRAKSHMESETDETMLANSLREMMSKYLSARDCENFEGNAAILKRVADANVALWLKNTSNVKESQNSPHSSSGTRWKEENVSPPKQDRYDLPWDEQMSGKSDCSNKKVEASCESMDQSSISSNNSRPRKQPSSRDHSQHSAPNYPSSSSYGYPANGGPAFGYAPYMPGMYHPYPYGFQEYAKYQVMTQFANEIECLRIIREPLVNALEPLIKVYDKRHAKYKEVLRIHIAIDIIDTAIEMKSRQKCGRDFFEPFNLELCQFCHHEQSDKCVTDNICKANLAVLNCMRLLSVNEVRHLLTKHIGDSIDMKFNYFDQDYQLQTYDLQIAWPLECDLLWKRCYINKVHDELLKLSQENKYPYKDYVALKEEYKRLPKKAAQFAKKLASGERCPMCNATVKSQMRDLDLLSVKNDLPTTALIARRVADPQMQDNIVAPYMGGRGNLLQIASQHSHPNIKNKAVIRKKKLIIDMEGCR